MSEQSTERTVLDILITPEQRNAVEERLNNLASAWDEAKARERKAAGEAARIAARYKAECELAQRHGLEQRAPLELELGV